MKNRGWNHTIFFRILTQSMFMFFISASLMSAQTSGRIRGKVLDEESLQAVKGAVVSIKDLELKGVSDAQGEFVLSDISPGIYEVVCSFPNFETQVKSNIQIKPGDTVSLDFKLKTSLARVTEKVTVEGELSGEIQPNTTSSFTFTSEVATKLPGTYQDMSRILSSLPAAAHVTDKSNDLIVRGGSPWENGFFIDNIPIPNINHFQRQGQSGGPIGLVNVQLIDDIQLLTGGFSAKYGNRMSSIVDINFKEGRKDKFHSSAVLHLAGFGGLFEGPIFKKRGSWILSLNRSYYDVLARIVGYNVAPRFGDVHFKFTYDLNPRNKLTLLNIYGDSSLEYDLEEAVELGFNDYLHFGTSQNTSGINWFTNWGNSGYSNTSLSYSFFRIEHSITASNQESSNRKYSLTQEYNGDLYFRSSSYFKIGRSADIQFGIDLNNHMIVFDNFISAHISRWEEDLPEAQAEGRTRASQSGAFVMLSFRPVSLVTATAGLRMDHYSYNDHWRLSPRISLAWNAAKKLTLSAAFGMFHQNVPLSILATNKENKKNRDPYAVHYVVGISYRVFEDMNLSIDIYDKEYRALPLTPEDPTQFIMDTGVDMGFYRSYDVLLDFGKAYARGVEFLLQKKLMKGFYGLVSGTVFRSRFRDVLGVWRNRINDNVYALKIIGGYLPKKGWGLSVRFNLSGGLPYTPLDPELSKEYNRRIFIKEKALSERYQPYMTLDIRVDKEIRWNKSTLFIYLGATNFLNKKNVDSYFWNRIENKQDVFFQAPILPVFGFELVF